MHRTIATRILLTAVLGATACGNDSGGFVLPDGGAGEDSGVPAGDAGCSVEPTFTSLHDVVLSDAVTCAAPGCHGRSPSRDFSLDTGKAAVYAELLTEPTGSNGAVAMYPTRVKPGDPAASFFFLKLTEDRPPAGDRMPTGCSSQAQRFCLEPCVVDAFRTWIQNGAQDD